MNARRKITEEAEKKAKEQDAEDEPDDVQDNSTGDARDGQDESEEEDSSERKQLTQRMPKDLVGDVDAVADHLGMTRNAAINMFCRQKAEEMIEQLGLEDDE